MESFEINYLKGYTITPNTHQRDKSISLKAKGLLSQMFSLPDSWDYTLKGLAHINREGIDAIRAAIRELEQAGYIVRERVRDEKGMLRGTKYKVYAEPRRPVSGYPALENPTLDNPTLDVPTQAEPTQENQTQLNIDIRNKEPSITDPVTIDSFSSGRRPSVLADLEAKRNEEKLRQIENYREIIMENISYEYLLRDLPYDHDRLEEILELIVETVCTTKKTIRVAGMDYPAEVVRSRFLKLDMEHIKFVIDCLKENTTKIRNIKQYLLTTLYNAPTTIDNYYSARVQHDLYGDSRD